MRQKLCALCEIDSNTMYRVIYRQGDRWIFVCKQCLINVKNNNPHYKYGGTWKRKFNLLFLIIFFSFIL